MTEYLANLCGYALTAVCIYLFYGYFLKERWRRGIIFFLYVGYCAAYLCLSIVLPVGYGKILLGLALTFLLTLAYEGKLLWKLFLAVTMFPTGVLAEGAAGLLMVAVEGARLDHLLEYQRIQGLLIGRSLVFVMAQLMGYFARKWPVRMRGTVLAGFMVLPLATIVCIFQIVGDAAENLLPSVLAASLLLFSNVFVFFLFMRQVKMENDQAKLEFLDAQMEKMEQHYRELYQSYRHTARLRHDQKNFLLSLFSMAENGQTAQVCRTIQQALGDMEKDAKVVDTGNYVIDAILDAKRRGGENIRWSYQIGDLTECGVEIFDVAMLLAVLLDNGVEAQAKCSQPWIDVKVRQTQQFLMVQVSNGFDGVVQYEEGRLATRKKDRKNHGFGLETVEQIVKKYQGTLELRPEGKCFTANCVLQKQD